MIHRRAAFLAGVIGGAVMSASMALFRASGVPVNLEMMLGTLTTMPPGTLTWLLGFAMHLVISGAIGIAYAYGFVYVTRRASWRDGLVIAILHGIASGLIMGIVPAIHPQIPGTLPAPGFFMAALGRGAVVDFWVARFVYGATVGALGARMVTPRGRRG